MEAWQLQEAKARLSEVIKQACHTGPQNITVRGKATAVVLSTEDYKRLTCKEKNFIEFLRASPLTEVKINLERDRSKPRDIDW
ncbi:MAG: type II toxin-antitoxin system Phd/YefM family antitoxin [Gammaproteobacteria bacterium]|nr:type II toxin-antitoxin system Phd/YefM family antitoxin [Gammaproteobacteria bacterium]